MSQSKIITWRKIVFELQVIGSNPFINMFGVAFPLFLSCVICRSIAGEVGNTNLVQEATTQVFLSIGTIIPMATVLMGYAISHAIEIEKEISERMSLFGISLMETVLNRILAQLVYMAGCFLIYFTVGGMCGYILAPDIRGVVIYALCICVLTVILFVLGHGISTLCRKFGLTYFVAMVIYFAIMIFSGLMGISYEQLPKWMRAVSKLSPVTYMNQSDYVKAWLGNSYNFGPIVQAFLFLGALTGILLFLAERRERRISA